MVEITQESTASNIRRIIKKWHSAVWVGLSIMLLTNCTDIISDDTKADKEWPSYGGNAAGNRYSSLKQINLDNVHELEVAWKYQATDSVGPGERQWTLKCQPIMIDGILYGTGSYSKLFAVDAATGQELWKFEPAGNRTNRGLNFWQNGEDKRILYVAGSHLYAINATTGKPIREFGENGRVDFHTGLENERFDIQDLTITATSPGVVYKDILVMGSAVSESGDALPGHIRGFDVRTGQLVWIFHTIPQPGEPGYETWPKDAYKKIGGANNWAGMVLDEERGMVYLGTGSPSVDYYGGARAGKNLFGNCILALDVETGKLKWYYQTIHHDLWDLDIPCPPNLVQVKHKGKMVDALVQTTKDGLVYLLDRDTGKSLFPVEERPVPTTGLPGEHPFPTQKFPVKPLPLVTRQVITEADLPDSIHFPESFKSLKAQFLKTRHGSKYIPPSMEGFWYIGTGGGAEWGGNSVDPNGILYQNVSELPTEIIMVDTAERMKASASYGNSLYITHCAVCHGLDRKGNGSTIPSLVDPDNNLSRSYIKELIETGRGRMPSFRHIRQRGREAIVRYILGEESQEPLKDEVHEERNLTASKDQDFPYLPPYIHLGNNRVLDADGYPGIKPPWGTLNAIDLNTGEYLWRVPLGEYEELTQKGIPITGTPNIGGPITTAGGLIFIAASEDKKIRAFDKKTGTTVWEHSLPASGFATPITYEVGGKQYVVIAAGGRDNDGTSPGARGSYIAFSLP